MKVALVSGFLGSGKTTAIIRACQLLEGENLKAAVITNDQGDQQVDTALVRSLRITVGEVASGCFCCHYAELEKHIEFLTKNGDHQIIFAEAVGSCTDLVATIVKPFQDRNANVDIVISVFVDAEFLDAVVDNRSCFISDSIRYIYKKQMEEADLLVINKTDLLTPDQLSRIRTIIETEYSHKTILYQSSLEEGTIRRWLDVLNGFETNAPRRTLAIDYDTYAVGEGEMAWVDRSIKVKSEEKNAVTIATAIIHSLFNDIREAGQTIGHLKFFVKTENFSTKVSFTTTSTVANLSFPDCDVDSVDILINARVQSDPELIAGILDKIVSLARIRWNCEILEVKSSAFTPSYPTPTYRIQD
jgi:G3E family GTPase